MDIRKVREQLYQGVSIYDLPLCVTFYARVSTEKYEQTSSLENQIQYYTNYIAKNKMWTYVDGYIDDGISGTSTKNRDSFNRMIADAKRGAFDLIVTKEISRFSRSTLDSIKYTQDLLTMGVGVYFQNDNINTLDTDSEFRLVVMAGVAQDEVRKLSERLKFGFRQSIYNGRVLGNDRLYGYNKEKCKLTINEQEAEIVRLIFSLYVNERMGMRKISNYLYDHKGITSRHGNEFNATTMKNMILNPKYKGFYCANKTRSIDYKTKKSIKLNESEWIVYKDESIPAIVSEDIWNKAYALLKSRGQRLRESGAEHHNLYTYSGKIQCAEHGTSFHRQVLKSQKGDKEIWQCKIYRQKGLAACSAPQLWTSELNAIMTAVFSVINIDRQSYIVQVLELIKSTPDNKKYDTEIADINEAITEIEAKKDKLLDISVDGAISNQEFKIRNDKFNKKVENLQDRLRQLIAEHETSQNLLRNYSKIKKALEKEFSFEGENSDGLISAMLDKIIVHNTGNRKNIKLDVRLKNGEIIPFEFERNINKKKSFGVG